MATNPMRLPHLFSDETKMPGRETHRRKKTTRCFAFPSSIVERTTVVSDAYKTLFTNLFC